MQPLSAEDRIRKARKKLMQKVESAGGDPKEVESWDISLQDTTDVSKRNTVVQRVIFDSGKRRFQSIPQVISFLDLQLDRSREPGSKSRTKVKTKGQKRARDLAAAASESKSSKKQKRRAHKRKKRSRASDAEATSIKSPGKAPRQKSRIVEVDQEEIDAQRTKLEEAIKAWGGDPVSISSWEVRAISVQNNSKDAKCATRKRFIFCDGKKKLRSLPQVRSYLNLGSEEGNNDEIKRFRVKNMGRKKTSAVKTEKRLGEDSSSSPEPASVSEPGDADETSSTTGKQSAAPPLPKLGKWQQMKITKCGDRADPNKVREYLEEGFTIFPSVLQAAELDLMLEGPPEEGPDSQNRYMFMRRRKGNQQWMGAKRTIEACVKNMGNPGEIVLSPLVTREPGRYDMPLPQEACFKVEQCLESTGLMAFVKYLCRGGKLRTQDIMLSTPGSTDQRCHTDSCWKGRDEINPKTHYMTVLIPLTVQDEETGGTRVWPKSHRRIDALEWDKDFVDMVEPRLKRGDALVFDGLLSHLGMRNISTRNRYFYYAAFSNCHDPNTDVTGN
ncbi:Dioxygenase andA [Hondaea fermentalgiana]|uniref:Dioxygenase andA n=1 Tax=Hondaea fermentalgiana TaxID=2315210 RepID=A0A2R5G8Y3_9STRA|nr:Dioxygenase andA [Hondaea fermentalgiana]|eukprot:GBG24124.1 Dioxygenase andA [Hondaea fermentalgiana]